MQRSLSKYCKGFSTDKICQNNIFSCSHQSARKLHALNEYDKKVDRKVTSTYILKQLFEEIKRYPSSDYWRENLIWLRLA